PSLSIAQYPVDPVLVARFFLSSLLLHPLPSSFFFQSYGDHRDLHSFPTRRSSDLLVRGRRSRSPSAALATASSARGSSICDSARSEEHTSELQSRSDLVCRLLLEKKKKK